MAKTKDFGEVVLAKIAKNDDLAALVRKEKFNADIAMKVYEMRMQAGLSQKTLAELLNTKQSVISRLEDADYDGHSLALLWRISEVLNKDLNIVFDNRTTIKLEKTVEYSKVVWHDNPMLNVNAVRIECNPLTNSPIAGVGSLIKRAESTELETI